MPPLEHRHARTKKNKLAALEQLEDRRLLAASQAEFMPLYLVSDQANHALLQDANLVNPWGIDQRTSSFQTIGSGDFSIADHNTGSVTQYGGNVNGSPLVPAGAISVPGGSPTGVAGIPVFGNGSNQNNGFTISNGSSSAPADFLFAGGGGRITGWNPNVSANSAELGAIAANANFTGLAFGRTTQQGPVVYATDFQNNKIVVFDSLFHLVSLSGSFTDPNLPAGEAPYNIENLNGTLFVAYAKQAAGGQAPVIGQSYGTIDAFNQDGTFLGRVATSAPGTAGSHLDAPWGMAVAPSSFSQYIGDLLVANTGTGQITAFNIQNLSTNLGTQTDFYDGTLLDPRANPLTIDGLRGLSVGNDATAGSSSVLYFTADPNNATHGLFGSIISINNDSGSIGVPLVAAGGQFAAGFNTAFNGTVATFSDVYGQGTGANPFTTMINWGDGFSSAGSVIQVGANQYLVQGNHTYTVTGSYNVTVSIADSHANNTTVSSIATVAPTSSGALAATGVNFSAAEGTNFNGKVATFTDGDGNTSPSAYTASINWGDGTITSGAISASGNGFQVVGQHAYSGAGNDVVTITIHDSDGDSATATAAASIATSGALNAQAAPVAPTEGIVYKAAVATFTDTDTALTASDFSANIVWGDGASTAGTISGANGKFTVSGAHAYADEDSFAGRVTILQTAGGTGSATVALAARVADAALTFNGAPISGSVGSTFSGTVATFTDANPQATSGDYSATIRWGDGTSAAGTLSGTGPFTITGKHAYTTSGNFTVTTDIRDVGGSSVSGTSSATVSQYPLTGSPANISGSEGATFSGTVATFTDANPNGGTLSSYSASIDWGDGATTAGTISGSAGNYTVNGAHAFADEVTAVTVVISENGNTMATVQSPATIADADLLSGTADPVTATEGLPLTAPLATFNDAYTANPASAFTATIVWGDGVTTSGIVSGQNGIYAVRGNHAYADEGTQTAHVTLRDKAPGTASASVDVSVQITDAPLVAGGYTFYPLQNSTFHGAVAQFNDANGAAPASDFTANIVWSDGTTSAGNVVAAGGGLFNVVGTHSFGQVGSTAQATVTVHDIGGSNVTIQSTAKVVDGTLSISVSPVTATAQTQGTFTVATFADSGPLDPLADYSATIDWGDGGSSSGVISVNGGTLTVTGSHTYSDAGSYRLGVTAAETNGSTATGQATATVVSAGGATTPDQQFVNALFQDLLGRQADPAALQYFGNLAAANRAQVVFDIVHSGEYLADQVRALYEQYLHRAADSGGLDYFVSLLQNGENLRQVAVAMAASPEFFSVQGGSTSDGFLSALFEDALGRPIGADAQQFFGQQLASGASRDRIVAEIMSSAEHLAGIVNGEYEQLLSRPADAGALSFWIVHLQSGMHQADVAVSIGQSPEFYNKVT